MIGYWVMLKTNIKLLLRNKGYLIVVIVLPLLSVALLNIKLDKNTDNYYKIEELTTDQINLTSFEDKSKLIIKVYDSANNEASKYFLESLSASGMYRIYRFASGHMSEKEIIDSVTATADGSSIQALLYISDDFMKNDGITIYPTGKDDRVPLLEQHIIQNIQIIRSYTDNQGNVDWELLKQQEVNREVVTMDLTDNSTLNAKQLHQQSNIAFSLTTMILGFVFTGICITSVIQYERDYQVTKKFSMIPNVNKKYILVKATITGITVLLQCIVTMVGFITLVNLDFGISPFQYTVLIFGLGIIFNLLSVMIGIVISNTMTTGYIVFFIWTASNMLSGVYFPGVEVPLWWEKIALFMPQKWMLLTSEALLINNTAAGFTYMLVVIGFILLIVTLGFFGIKVNEQE